MTGKIEDKEKLIKLQELDNILLDGADTFNNSPIAKQINEVRQKKDEIKQKRDQIDKVFVKAREEIEFVANKDSEYAASQDKLQKEIEQTSGDYRKVEDLTTKLNQITGQRSEIDKKLSSLEENFEKIKQLKEKIDTSIEKLSMQEDDLNKNLTNSNAQLKLQMDDAIKKKQELEPQISKEALEVYRKARSIAGKITVAKNENNTCSVCQASFSNANISKIEEQKPIAVCPNCCRVLL